MDLEFILYMIVFGAIVGAVARLLVPGHDALGWVGTIVLGIVGSFVGGTLGAFLFNGGEFDIKQAGTILGAIVGAVIALLIYRQVNSRGGARV